MASIPGAAVTASRYGETVVLYSEQTVEVGGVYGAPPGPDGYSWAIPAGRPVKVPYEVGRFVREHLPNTGVVEVVVSETKDELGNTTGTTYDLKTAKAASTEKLKAGDERAFKAWLSGTVEDYVKRNKPVPEPPESIMTIIQRRGYDPKKYGIVPIGWAEREGNAANEALQKQIDELKAQLAAAKKA